MNAIQSHPPTDGSVDLRTLIVVCLKKTRPSRILQKALTRYRPRAWLLFDWGDGECYSCWSWLREQVNNEEIHQVRLDWSASKWCTPGVSNQNEVGVARRLGEAFASEHDFNRVIVLDRNGESFQVF